MARYKLMIDHKDGDGEIETKCFEKSTKKQIDKWVEDNIKVVGLDWRVGYEMKFRDCDCIYTWRWINNNKLVKP